MDKYEKTGGEEAQRRLITEIEAEELARLERIIPLYPKVAKVVDVGYIRGLTSIPGNTFREHKSEPDDIVA